MKKTILFTFLLFISASVINEIHAQGQNDPQRFGLGIMIGEPTGITGKYWMNTTNALAGGVAWSFRGPSHRRSSNIHLHLDYQAHNFNLFNVEQGTMGFYYGIGGRLRTGGDANIGVRIPLGLNYLFADNPLEIYFEIVPILDLMPDTDLEGNGGIGIRYYF
ncbi:MAG: hypothetical protein ACNA8K_04320 [Cyclonatronaceae bacterium]